jgi:hypothetical protein
MNSEIAQATEPSGAVRLRLRGRSGETAKRDRLPEVCDLFDRIDDEKTMAIAACVVWVGSRPSGVTTRRARRSSLGMRTCSPAAATAPQFERPRYREADALVSPRDLAHPRPEFRRRDHDRHVGRASVSPYAANLLRINDHLLVAAGFPELTSKLRARGFGLIVLDMLDMSEVEKMDGGLSCLSLRL